MRGSIKALLVAAAVAVAACGGGDGAAPGAPNVAEDQPLAADVEQSYGLVAGAVRTSVGPFCPADNGGEFTPSVPPSSAGADSPHLQFTDGRTYELAPCNQAAANRSQLRVYRFADPAVRDAAITANMARSVRPQTSWRYTDHYSVELWLLAPSADASTTAAMAKAHDAVRVLPGMRVVLGQ